MLRITVCLILFPAVLMARPLTNLPSGIEIPRFQMIAEGLYRGGQPDEHGFEYLKQQGFKTIINLRAETDEAEVVKKLGMNYVQIAIDEPRPSSTIPDAMIRKY